MLQRGYSVLLALGLLGGPAVAATFCVNDGSELRSALITAGNNGANDEIRVAIGIHEVDSGATAFSYSTSENFSLSIIGGYNATCTSLTNIASLTTLDGEDQRQVLSLKGSSGSSGFIGVTNLVIRYGYSDQQGAGLSIGGPAGFAGSIGVQNVIFLENTSTTAIGGLAVTAPLGTINVLDSLFLGNACAWDYCAFDLISSAPSTSSHPIPVLFGNNTVVDNLCISGAPASCDVSGGRFFGDAHAAFFNNAFAYNEDSDLRLQGSNVDLDHNHLPAWVGTPASAIGNFAFANPLFAGPGNYRLRSDSPLLNAGTIGSYPFFTVDLDGQTRVFGPSVDIGAFENHVAIFGNGFETPM